jgi:hypothetical protein
MLAGLHPLKLSGFLFSALVYSAIYTVKSNLKLKSIKLTSNATKVGQSNSALSNLTQGAWKWEHYTLFTEWQYKACKRHDYCACKYEYL